jgi:TolB-like protein
MRPPTRSTLATTVILAIALSAAALPGFCAERPWEYDVAVIPFKNLSNQEVVDQIYDAVVEVFAKHNLKVCPRHTVDSYMQRRGLTQTHDLEKEQQAQLARAVSTRFVVTGTIKQFRSDKKFRIGGFLLSPLTGAATTYGTVELESEIFDRAKQAITWSQTDKKTKKKQFLGTYASRNQMAQKALRAVVERLYKTFFDSL